MNDGNYDRIEELISDIQDAIERIPNGFGDLRRELEKIMNWTSEELKIIYLEA